MNQTVRRKDYAVLQIRRTDTYDGPVPKPAQFAVWLRLYPIETEILVRKLEEARNELSDAFPETAIGPFRGF